MNIKHSNTVNVSVTAFDILVLSQNDKQKYLSVLSFPALITYLSNDTLICLYVMVLKEVIFDVNLQNVLKTNTKSVTNTTGCGRKVPVWVEIKPQSLS